MAQICIFYASPDRMIVKNLAGLLSEYWSVWWDSEIASGDWRAQVEAALHAEDCKCALVVWSSTSRSNRTVIDEATLVLNLKKELLPVFVENVSPPLSFGGLSPNDFVGWDMSPTVGPEPAQYPSGSRKFQSTKRLCELPHSSDRFRHLRLKSARMLR
jgi:hypothetical protein